MGEWGHLGEWGEEQHFWGKGAFFCMCNFPNFGIKSLKKG